MNSTLRVLVVRLGAMGDILHALPAITALRAVHPGWHIGWAVEPQWVELLSSGASMPLVNCVHLVPVKRWARAPLARQTLRELRATRRALREGRYDVGLDLQGAVRSAALARWSGAPRVVGEATPREPLARLLFTERIDTRSVHVIERAREVAEAICCEPLPMLAPALPLDPDAERWCDSITGASRFVLLNPGAGWGAKRWPVERYAAVASALAAQGYSIVANAGPGEEPLAAHVAQAAGGVATSPGIGQLIALIRRAQLVIAGDTGPLHLASALGRPVVGIFGPTDPARNGPFGGRFRVLRHPESRRDHARRAEPEAGLLTITPEAVLEAATALLRD